MRLFIIIFSVCTLSAGHLSAQPDTIFYTVHLENASEHIFEVTATLDPGYTGVLDFKIPAWTPGYYQLLHFNKNISGVKACDKEGHCESEIVKTDQNTWRVPVTKGRKTIIHYKVSAKDKFISLPFATEDWAFIRPTGIFLFPMTFPRLPARITLTGQPEWTTVSGLDGKGNTFYADNMDQLYDSPILTGNLQTTRSFLVKGIPHYLSGIKSGLPAGNDLLFALKRMVESATDLMGDIPYQHYSFMSLGKGNGGIEQTNSTAFALDASSFQDSAGRQRTLNFLTHEYFHHFNVKRIRPIELGPFDYTKENRTNLLWVSEGLTVYFEDIILNRAGLKTREEMLTDWARMIETYENNPGRRFQSLAESSYHTWEDGPFGVKGKTISSYEKGPVIGMLLDLTIRVHTENKRSLADVMTYLYQRYYKEKQRGFSESEFKAACEKMAGRKLDNIFSYVYNTNDISYENYFEPAGLVLSKTTVGDEISISLNISPRLSTAQQWLLNDLFRKF